MTAAIKPDASLEAVMRRIGQAAREAARALAVAPAEAKTRALKAAAAAVRAQAAAIDAANRTDVAEAGAAASQHP